MGQETLRAFSTVDAWSLAASVVSVVLAVFSIGLSIWFFKESLNYAQEGTRAAESIAASVKKLEALFDRLYADTFSVMRETYADMRKHVWPNAEVTESEHNGQKGIKEKLDILTDRLATNVAEIVKRQTQSEEDISLIKNEIRKSERAALNEAVANTVEAIDSEVKEPRRSRLTPQYRIRRFFREKAKIGEKFRAGSLVDRLVDEVGLSFPDILNSLEKLRDTHFVKYEGPLGPDTEIEYMDAD